MRLSRYFIPVLKENPAEAQIVSHRLMLRAGLIKQATAGIYSWLPLGFKVLRRLENIIHEEQQRAGHQAIQMPILQSADLWRESGRYDDYGQEMLRMKDRHDRDLLFTPTAEELVTDIFRSHITSYKDLPLTLYQIQWKFRDEIRPRFGVMLVRVFYMKDGHKHTSERKFLTGFVLVQMEMSDTTWHLVKKSPKVMGFIGGSSDKPAPISDAEAHNIMNRIQEGVEKPKHKVLFEPGEVVRVIDGPFNDFNGVVEEVNYEKSRMLVAVQIFGRSTPVELEFGQVEKG